MPKFVAQFWTKHTNSNRLWFEKAILVDYNKLSESKRNQKPDRHFSFKKGSYLYNENYISGYDKKGRPILKYILGESEPFLDINDLSPDKQRTNAEYMYQTFQRGEMKAIIAGSQKTKDEYDLKSLIIGGLIGAGLTYMILNLAHIVK